MQPTVNIVPSENLPISKVYHPSVDINQKDKLKYVAFMGAKDTVYYEYPASALSSAQAIFTVQLPSRETVLDRRMYAKFNFTVKFNLSANSGGMYVGGGTFNTNGQPDVNWCLRQYPVTACTSTIAVDLNSSRFSYNPATITHAFSRYGQNELFARTFRSPGAGQRDLLQNVVNAAASDPRDPTIFYGYNTAEETRNIMNYLVSVQSDNKAGSINGNVYPDTRPTLVCGDNASTSVSFTFETYEPVMCSPFVSASQDEPGLTGLNNMQIVYTFASNLARVIEGLPDSVTATTPSKITSVNVTLNDARLMARLYTLHMDYPRPAQMYWSIYDVQRYIQQSSIQPVIASAASQNDFPIQSQVINFSSHPKYIFVYVKPSEYVEQDITGVTLCDTFCRLKKIDVIYCNKLCLQNATELDLYAMSVKNGLTDQWSMWRAFTGSVLCLNVSTDLSLGEGESSGVGNGQYSFQINVTAQRPESQIGTSNFASSPAITAYSMDLCVVPVFEGFLTCGADGIMKTIIGPLRKEQVLKAPTEHGAFEYYNALYKLFGSGSPVETLKSIAKSVPSLVQKVSGLIAPVERHLAREEHPEEHHESQGGRLLSRHDLAKRLQKL